MGHTMASHHHHKSPAALFITRNCPNPSQRRLLFLFQFFLGFVLVVCRTINGASENANGQWLSFFDRERERERERERGRALGCPVRENSHDHIIGFAVTSSNFFLL
jgi:hypothetical protein